MIRKSIHWSIPLLVVALLTSRIIHAVEKEKWFRAKSVTTNYRDHSPETLLFKSCYLRLANRPCFAAG